MRLIKAKVKRELTNWLNSGQPVGVLIAWAQSHLMEIRASNDAGLAAFADGIEAWLKKDYTQAAIAWRACRAAGLRGALLDELLSRVEPDSSSTVTVHVDGSFTTRSGGVACVWQRDGNIGVLARYLPGPLPDNHYVEAYALRLALTATELADCSLVLYTDSQTIMRALQNPTSITLPQKTMNIVLEINQLCAERGAEVHHRRARTGQLLHDKADQMAKWVRARGDLQKQKGVIHE